MLKLYDLFMVLMADQIHRLYSGREMVWVTLGYTSSCGHIISQASPGMSASNFIYIITYAGGPI